MVESSAENPNSSQPDGPPPQNCISSSDPVEVSVKNSGLRYPPVRVTTEFDSQKNILSNKISCKIFDGVAKLKASFNNGKDGEIREPKVGFITKYLTVLYDLKQRNALVNGSLDVGRGLQFKGKHSVKEQQGEVTIVTCLADPSYKLQLTFPVQLVALPKAIFKFPVGELQLEEKVEVSGALAISGILRGHLMNGACTARFKDEDLNLQYSYKDGETTFIPRISLPSNKLSFAFKRRFNPSDKLSYWYDFDSSHWNAVYKHTVGKDLKVKAGYESAKQRGWASIWVGKEKAGAKQAPNKMKIQVMLQSSQDRPWELVFKLKKRWDL